MLQAPSLSLIESEARRLVRRLSGQRLRTRQKALEDLCGERWAEVRGPEPATGLARSLWRIEPPLAHLFVELYEAGDPRLEDLLGSLNAAQGLALLVLAEVGRGDADAVHIAYDAMRHFEVGAEQACIARVKETARWMGEPQPAGRQGARLLHAGPLHRGVAAIVAETGRPDWRAVLEAIGILASGRDGAADDPHAARILSALERLGLAFVQVDHHRIRYSLHGAEKSITPERLAEALAQVRMTRVA